MDRSEVDGPDVNGDGLEGYELTSEQGADVNYPLLPANAADLADEPLLEVSRISEGIWVAGSGSG